MEMESKSEYEELLATLGESLAETEESEADSPVPAAELLVAYREDRLSAAESARLEHLLANSAAARGKLAEMAPIASQSPAPALRDKVLAAFDAAFDSSSPSASVQTARWGAGRLFSLRRRPRRHPRRWGLAAAAAVAVAGAFLLLESAHFMPAPRPLPPDLDYAVSVEGLARERGRSPRASLPGERSIVAYPETVVRIEVSPREAGIDGVEFGLYRWCANSLARIDSGVDLEAFRGAARLSVRADDLAGPPKQTPSLIFVAVARAGDLPPALVAAGPESARHALEDEGRRRAYPFAIHLLDPGESSANH